MDGFSEISSWKLLSESIFHSILYLLISIVVYFVLPHLFLPYLRRRSSKKFWIEFLKNNSKIIKKLFKELKEIEEPKTEVYEFIFMVSSIVAFLFTYLTLLGLYHDELKALNHSTLILSVLPFLYQIKLYGSILSLKEFTDKNKKFSRRIHYIRSYIYPLTIASYSLLALVIIRKVNIPENDAYTRSALCFAAIFLSVMMYETFRAKNDLKKISKNLLNKKYKAEYPTVIVRTDLVEVEGRLEDIFDDRLIKVREFYEKNDLGRYRTHGIPWESIKILTIIEERGESNC